MGDTLNFGYQFQCKVLSSMLSDLVFFNQIYDILHPSYFDTEGSKLLIEGALLYFKEYKKAPTLEVFKVQMSNIKSDVQKAEATNFLREAWANRSADDLEFVKKTTHEFCKNQELKRAILKSVDFLNAGRYDDIPAVINSAMKAGMNTEIGHEYLRDIGLRYAEEDVVERISTGWEVIDEIMGGGMPRKKMGIVMAPSGIGKTWALCALGAAGLKQGKTVLHVTLELDEIYVGKRYDAILSGYPMDDLKYHIPDLEKTLKRVPGKLIIKEFPPRGLSVVGLLAFCEKLEMMGIPPDEIIIDYPELMKMPTSDKRDDQMLGDLYIDLRGVAGVRNAVLWAVDQTNRSGTDKDVIESNSISNGYAKIFALDFVMSLSRRPKDKVSNTARFHIAKNRFGPDGMTFPATFDTAKAKIQIYHEKSESGIEAYTNMTKQTDDQYEKKYLLNKFDQLMMSTPRTENNVF